MVEPTITSREFKRRLWIWVVVLGLVIVGLTAFLIWWPRPASKNTTAQLEVTTADQTSLPEALQSQEEAIIDNSDILAQGSETFTANGETAVNQLTLMVRNHSQAVDPVNVKITLDGRVIVKENFSYGSAMELPDGTKIPAPGLDWKQLPLKLSVGPHQIQADSANGQATFNTDFTTTDRDWWASLEYIDGQKFDWELSELPILPL